MALSLICLSKVYANIEFLGCSYPSVVMEEIDELTKNITLDEHSNEQLLPQPKKLKKKSDFIVEDEKKIRKSKNQILSLTLRTNPINGCDDYENINERDTLNHNPLLSHISETTVTDSNIYHKEKHQPDLKNGNITKVSFDPTEFLDSPHLCETPLQLIQSEAAKNIDQKKKNNKSLTATTTTGHIEHSASLNSSSNANLRGECKVNKSAKCVSSKNNMKKNTKVEREMYSEISCSTIEKIFNNISLAALKHLSLEPVDSKPSIPDTPKIIVGQVKNNNEKPTVENAFKKDATNKSVIEKDASYDTRPAGRESDSNGVKLDTPSDALENVTPLWPLNAKHNSTPIGGRIKKCKKGSDTQKGTPFSTTNEVKCGAKTGTLNGTPSGTPNLKTINNKAKIFEGKKNGKEDKNLKLEKDVSSNEGNGGIFGIYDRDHNVIGQIDTGKDEIISKCFQGPSGCFSNAKRRILERAYMADTSSGNYMRRENFAPPLANFAPPLANFAPPLADFDRMRIDANYFAKVGYSLNGSFLSLDVENLEYLVETNQFQLFQRKIDPSFFPISQCDMLMRNLKFKPYLTIPANESVGVKNCLHSISQLNMKCEITTISGPNRSFRIEIYYGDFLMTSVNHYSSHFAQNLACIQTFNILKYILPYIIVEKDMTDCPSNFEELLPLLLSDGVDGTTKTVKGKQAPLTENNIGFQMLAKMGWKGGNLGKQSDEADNESYRAKLDQILANQGRKHFSRPDIPPLMALPTKSVKTSTLDTKQWGKIASRFQCLSLNTEDGIRFDTLVFEPTLTVKLRSIVHQSCMKLDVKATSYGKGSQRRLHIFPFKSYRHLLRHLSQESLIPPLRSAWLAQYMDEKDSSCGNKKNKSKSRRESKMASRMPGKVSGQETENLISSQKLHDRLRDGGTIAQEPWNQLPIYPTSLLSSHSKRLKNSEMMYDHHMPINDSAIPQVHQEGYMTNEPNYQPMNLELEDYQDIQIKSQPDSHPMLDPDMESFFSGNSFPLSRMNPEYFELIHENNSLVFYKNTLLDKTDAFRVFDPLREFLKEYFVLPIRDIDNLNYIIDTNKRIRSRLKIVCRQQENSFFMTCVSLNKFMITSECHPSKGYSRISALAKTANIMKHISPYIILEKNMSKVPPNIRTIILPATFDFIMKLNSKKSWNGKTEFSPFNSNTIERMSIDSANSIIPSSQSHSFDQILEALLVDFSKRNALHATARAMHTTGTFDALILDRKFTPDELTRIRNASTRMGFEAKLHDATLFVLPYPNYDVFIADVIATPSTSKDSRFRFPDQTYPHNSQNFSAFQNGPKGKGSNVIYYQSTSPPYDNILGRFSKNRSSNLEKSNISPVPLNITFNANHILPRRITPITNYGYFSNNIPSNHNDNNVFANNMDQGVSCTSSSDNCSSYYPEYYEYGSGRDEKGATRSSNYQGNNNDFDGKRINNDLSEKRPYYYQQNSPFEYE
ncbi:unnamed protein product [Gordionus sp. m RMFG-2023]